MLAAYIAQPGSPSIGTSFSKYAHPGTQSSGIFGKGADGQSFDCSKYAAGGSTAGSGSGYYGGYVDIEDFSGGYLEMSGAGGSSYVSKYSESFSSIHESHLFFTNISMLSKEDGLNFYDAYGHQEQGHFGNGYIKLTILSHSNYPLFACTHKPKSHTPFSPHIIEILLLISS